MFIMPEEIRHFAEYRLDNDVHIKEGYTPTEEELKIFNEFRKELLETVYVER